MLYPSRTARSKRGHARDIRARAADCRLLTRSMMKTLYDDSSAWSDAEVCRIGLQLRGRTRKSERALSERMARVDGDEKGEGDASLIIVISLPHVLHSPTAATAALDAVY